MAKKVKKKRNKKYTGVNAKQPSNIVRVRKVDAVVRSNAGQWLHDHADLIKKVLIVVAIVVVIVAGMVALTK